MTRMMAYGNSECWKVLAMTFIKSIRSFIVRGSPGGDGCESLAQVAVALLAVFTDPLEPAVDDFWSAFEHGFPVEAAIVQWLTGTVRRWTMSESMPVARGSS